MKAVYLLAALLLSQSAGIAARLSPETATRQAVDAALQVELARYQRLAAAGLPASVVQRLIAFGDLRAANLPTGDDTSDPAVISAIQRFQRRHGLPPDGTLSLATRQALNVPPSQRVRQIERALEHFQLVPPEGTGPVIVINIPAFRLWAWDDSEFAAGPALSMRVIVGRAAGGRTPAFSSTIESVVVRPYWNVPASIVRNEILPRLARDPGYLEREGFEMAGGRLRQRPGPRNALGLLKFVFRSEYNIYLHGTPSPQLFNRVRRDLSHGCIRAEDPVALAAWLLAGSEWSRDRIVAATESSETRTIELSRGVPIMLIYATAFVGPDDGLMYFVPDIYRLDPPPDTLTVR